MSHCRTCTCEEHELGDAPKSRRSDPPTAKTAADFVRSRRTSACIRLLEAYDSEGRALMDEEACDAAGLSRRSEYATRCSELRAAGLIAFTGQTRIGDSGTDRALSLLTPLGENVLDQREG